MLEDDMNRTIVSEWVEKAENDLRNAGHTLRLRENCPTDTVCFHAHQCVEKYIKTLLVLSNVAFPKTHNIAAFREQRCSQNCGADPASRLGLSSL